MPHHSLKFYCLLVLICTHMLFETVLFNIFTPNDPCSRKVFASFYPFLPSFTDFAPETVNKVVLRHGNFLHLTTWGCAGVTIALT